MATKQERARKKSQREMLAGEAALLLSLRRAVRQVAGEASSTGSLLLLRRLAYRVVAKAQRLTRARSNRTLRNEVAKALDGEVAFADAIVDGDAARARLIAKNLAKRWAEKTAALVADGSPYRASARQAAKAVEPYIELVARTETATAFNAERQSVLQRTVDFTRRANGNLLLFKMWDAEMDERTCPVCESMHGTLKRTDEEFEVDMPAHPRCRCMTTILLLSADTRT